MKWDWLCLHYVWNEGLFANTVGSCNSGIMPLPLSIVLDVFVLPPTFILCLLLTPLAFVGDVFAGLLSVFNCRG